MVASAHSYYEVSSEAGGKSNTKIEAFNFNLSAQNDVVPLKNLNGHGNWQVATSYKMDRDTPVL